MADINARAASDIAGTEAYQRSLMLVGADQATAILKLAPITALGRIPRIFVPAGNTTLTLAYSRGGIITSTSSGSTTLLLPTMAALGYTRNSTNPVELAFLFQRGGLGPLFVNADTAGGVTINWNDLDPQYLPKDHPPVMLISTGANTWAAC